MGSRKENSSITHSPQSRESCIRTIFLTKRIRYAENIKPLRPSKKHAFPRKTDYWRLFVVAWKQDPVKGSRLDKAVTYIRNRKENLFVYLEDGRCSLSNNLSENAIHPFVVIRKRWQFCDTPAEPRQMPWPIQWWKWQTRWILIITFLFEHQPNEKMSDNELEQLAPWNGNVKAEIQCRIECQENQEWLKHMWVVNVLQLPKVTWHFYFSNDWKLNAYHIKKMHVFNNLLFHGKR